MRMENCHNLRHRIIRKTKLGSSNSEIINILDKISKKTKIPPDIQNSLNNSCMNIIDTKLKREICEFFPRLKRIHIQKKYWKYARDITTKLFLKLPHKYKKGYLIYLEQDTYILDRPNIRAFEFLLQHFNDIVRYIGNRDESIHNDVFDFIVCFYGEHSIKPPTKVNSRHIVCSVTEYFFIKEIVDIEQGLF